MTQQDQPAAAPTVVPAAPAPGFLPTKGLPAIVAVVSAALSYWLLAACSTYFHFDLAAYAQPYVTLAGIALGIVPPPSAQPFIAMIIGLIIGRITPPSLKDMLENMTDSIVLAAKRDQSSPVGENLLIVPPVAPKPATSPPAAPPEAPRPSGL